MKDQLQIVEKCVFKAFKEDGVITGIWDKDSLTLRVLPEKIVHILTFLRDDKNCRFQQLIDVCGVDYPGRQNRFDVVYHLLSLRHNIRLRLKLETNETTEVPSVVSVFKSACWWEREAWDMYGIHFKNTHDLRRILTDYDFEGFPLRKDFPLTGYTQVRYSEEEKKIIHEPVSLVQEFRRFDFLSPWEGTKTVLPGDEKAEKA